MNEKENNKLIRKSAENKLVNTAEQFESETRLSCAPERIINPVLIKREKLSISGRNNNVSFSKNEKLMIAYNGGHIYVISILSAKCIQVIETNHRGNFAPAISANGKYIISIGFHDKIFQKENKLVREIIIWNTVLGTKLFSIVDNEMDTVLKAELSSDDQKIVVLGYLKDKQRKISVYDFKTGDLSYRICETVNDFVLTSDGKNAYFSESDQIRKIDLKTGKIERIFQCEQFVVDLAISADGKTIVGLEGSKLNDDVHRFYHINKTNFLVIDLDKDQMKLLRTDRYHEGFYLHPGGNYLVSHDSIPGFKPWEYKRTAAWDLMQGTPKDIGINLQNKTFPIYFSPDGKYLVEIKNSEIVFWDLDQKAKVSSIDFTQDYIKRSTFWVNNKKMLLWGENDFLDQISLEDGSVKNKIFKFHKIKNRDFRINGKGNLIAFTPDENTLEVWDIEKERKKSSFELDYHHFFDSVSFSNEQKEEIIAYKDVHNIIIRDLNSGKIIRVPKIEKSYIKKLRFCRDARTIFSQGYRFNVWYDIEWARPILAFRKPEDHSEYAGLKFGKINASYIDHDNMTCFLADTHPYQEKRQIHLLDLKHAQVLKEFTGYNSDVNNLYADHEMKAFISIHKDGEILKWNIETGQYIQLASKYQNIDFSPPIKFMKITENNKYLVIVDYKNQIYFWDYQIDKFLAKTYKLDNGYLWITPPDEFAPNGWLHTDRPDLISLIEMNKEDQQNPTFIYEDDQCFKDYMQIYNDQEMVMTRLNDWDRYQELLNIRLGNKNLMTDHLIEQGNLVLRLLPNNPDQ